MKAVQITRYGQRLAAKNVGVPGTLSPSDLLIKVHYAPIHPADIYFAKGVYGIKKALPTIVGLEGSGIVVNTGDSSAAKAMLGRKVAFMSDDDKGGTWAEYLVTSQKSCIPLQEKDDLEQASCLFVNPMTAMGFLDIAKSEGHECIIQTVASSAVGKMTIALMAKHNIKTINLIRSASHEDHLRAIGANYVINTSDPDYIEKIKAIIEEEKPSCFFDAVGSDICGTIFNMLPRKATCFSYGVISHQMISKLNPSELVFGQKLLRGFWLTEWMKSKSEAEMQRVKDQVRLSLSNELRTNIRAKYPLEKVNEAVNEYFQNMSLGKALLCPIIG